MHNKILLAVGSKVPAVRAGLRALLGTSEQNLVIAEFSDLEGLISCGEDLDVLVIEERLLESEVFEEFPLYPAPPAVLALGDDPQTVLHLVELSLPAWGLLDPDVGESELCLAVKCLSEGLVVLAPVIAEGLDLSQPASDWDLENVPDVPLTPREIEVLAQLARGCTNKQIAGNLQISPHTVKFHITSIYQKLGVNNRTEAVLAGIQMGLVVL